MGGGITNYPFLRRVRIVRNAVTVHRVITQRHTRTPCRIRTQSFQTIHRVIRLRHAYPNMSSRTSGRTRIPG